MNFNTLCNKYFKYIEIKLKPQSVKSIISRFQVYIIPYFKEKNIEDITPSDYLKWQEDIEKYNFKHSYKKSLHYAMVGLYSYLDLFWNYKENIPKKVGGFINNDIPSDLNYWKVEEFAKFINCFENKDKIYKAFFIVLFKTGIREGEALALNFHDIDYQNDTIHICKTISKENIGGKKIISIPKTKDSIRYIKIDKQTSELILELKKHYENENKHFNMNYYVFGGLNSLSVTSITRRMQLYTKLSGVKRIRIHDLRHSHATFLVERNIPIIEVSRRLGHSDINTTIKTYVHLASEYEKRATDALNSIKFL